MWSGWLILFGLVAARLRRGSVGALDPCLLVRPGLLGFVGIPLKWVGGTFVGDGAVILFGASFVAIAYREPSLLSRRREGFGEERPFSGNASLGARVARSGEAIVHWRDHVEDLALFAWSCRRAVEARLRGGLGSV